jgi:RNA polymerase sigma factor (sigma-70 family)
MSDIDPDLIQRARKGDDSAWAVIVRNHQEVVFRLCYLILGDADDAEDIAQEALIRAVGNLKNFDETRPLRPWLLQIARRLARNRQRSVGRYFNKLVLYWNSRMDGTTIKIESEFDRKAVSLKLWENVRKLDRIDQEVIYLRYFLDLSTTETAQVIQKPEGTVKSRLARALAKLQVMVEESNLELKEDFET